MYECNQAGKNMVASRENVSHNIKLLWEGLEQVDVINTLDEVLAQMKGLRMKYMTELLQQKKSKEL